MYSLVQWIQCDHFRGFADPYVDGYPSLSLSATTGDHPNLYQTKSLGGLWHRLTGVLSHIRTVCGQLWTKVSQMATNITSDGVNFWVSRMPKLEERSTDTLVNADGESTDAVQDLLAPVVNSGYPESIAAEMQHSVRTIASLLVLSPLGVDYSPFHHLLLSIVCQ